MPWVETSAFEEMAQGELREALESCETIRRKAVSRFWLFLTLAIVGGIAVAGLAAVLFELAIGVVVGVIALVVGVIAVTLPLSSAGEQIKRPMAEAIARRQGLTWQPKALGAPGFDEAERMLFGGASRRVFGDIWSGHVDDRAFAVYEVTLTRQSGKSTVTVFSGHVWRLAAGRTWPGKTLAVPDRGAFNFFKPAGGMSRVRYPEDVEFERLFEVYATDAATAQTIFTPALRSELTAIRNDAGRLFIYLGGDHVLAAIAGKDRFEAGSMFKATPGVERARAMWNEVEGSVGFARRLSAAFPAR